MRSALPLLIVLLALPSVSQTPSSHTPLNLVMPNGAGRIIVPSSEDIQWQTVTLYDNGTRPVFQIKDKTTGVTVSYVLFPNSTNSAAPQICRDDVLRAAMAGTAPTPITANIKQVKKSERTTSDGRQIALGSLFVDSVMDMKLHQQNEFAVMASPTTCAEVHVSLAPYETSNAYLLASQIDAFTFDPAYVPSSQDYFTLGAVFYKVFKAYASAAFYYQRTLESLPDNSPINFKRVVTDQLAMSYGISGQLKRSREVNESAIKSDPDYPLYYYNLACADAEEGHAAAARTHLEQAFARRANTLKGETLPDPTKDDSILKLKNDTDFWAFVQSLPKN